LQKKILPNPENNSHRTTLDSLTHQFGGFLNGAFLFGEIYEIFWEILLARFWLVMGCILFPTKSRAGSISRRVVKPRSGE
jgi:hypothetical protein